MAVINTAMPLPFVLKSQKLATTVPIDDNEDLVIDRSVLNCYEYD
jgi:hypothetical protein